MKIRLIYPKWPKLANQREFHLPPHGPVVFAAAVPEEHELAFTDENREPVDFDERPDLVCLSMMLTCQLPRGLTIADEFRARGVPVIAGGIATALHEGEVAARVDAAFVGEAEGRFGEVLDDLAGGKLRRVYDYLEHPVPIASVGTARRSILNRELYSYRGLQMPDLVHASRGCRFDCYPCCVRYLGGHSFRPRPIERVVAEVETIPNTRLFFVDNSLAQDRDWEISLFKALAPLKRHIISHPIEDDDEVLAAAAEAGAWWVYQAIFDTSDFIADRIRRLKQHGIFVEGTILLGLDDHDPDTVKRLVDFLLEIELDLAEFTVLTPFPHTRTFDDLEAQGRILHKDWSRYTAGEVVFRPARMTPDELQGMYQYAWDAFHAHESQAVRMARVLRPVTLADRRRAVTATGA
ncbi:MAG TPA: radical SAM protein [Polyangia bacterium]|nr:radical SAM protein [Polyangia bacterium]